MTEEALAGEGARTDEAAAQQRTIDARGLACPMPVIELAKAIDTVEVGEQVLLLATDPAARVDVPVWCRMQRHALRVADTDGDVSRFVVERRR